MTSHPTGNCWICGTETSHRCGPCAEAGIDIFFCSREHQKLVWLAHKRVCGKRSNPFTPPDFDDAEAELIRGVLEKEEREPDSISHTGNPDVIGDDLKMFFSGSQCRKTPPSSWLPQTLHNFSHSPHRFENEGLWMARGLSYDRLVWPVKDRQAYLDLNPFFHLASAQNLLRPPAVAAGAGLIPPSTPALHRGLLLFALVRRIASDTPPSSMEERFLTFAFQQFAFAAIKEKVYLSIDAASADLHPLRRLVAPVLYLDVVGSFLEVKSASKHTLQISAVVATKSEHGEGCLQGERTVQMGTFPHTL